MSAKKRCIAVVILVSFVCGVLVYVVSAGTSSSRSINPSNFRQRELSRSEIKERLKQVAQEGLRKGNARLTSDGRNLLNDMLSGAAARVFAVPDASPIQQERLAKAEESTRVLIRRTLELAPKPPKNTGNQKLIITENVIKEAWDICPIYPFC